MSPALNMTGSSCVLRPLLIPNYILHSFVMYIHIYTRTYIYNMLRVIYARHSYGFMDFLYFLCTRSWDLFNIKRILHTHTHTHIHRGTLTCSYHENSIEVRPLMRGTSVCNSRPHYSLLCRYIINKIYT